ncbi:disease resistance protein At4g27190-like [Pistacia vera]|uniref:disease resistance protein At4g27190-like n=1 Tax=Pistacia vera TaxID=55513 RepID=UPI0012631BA7|nr:disease resistance protein At4g27190-like [Pistacia vera]
MENLHEAVGKLFDVVFWVNVNPDGNVREVQEILVRQLNLKADEQNNDQRAEMISEELKNKRYVLFFDGVSSEINLEEVGICEEHEARKVVFACRDRNICWQTDVDINIRRLSDEDAGKLFWKIVGVHLKENRNIKPIARLIINECGGMPNMVKIIGASLKNVNDPAIWRSFLSQLRSPSGEQRQELEDFYRVFKLECDKLGDEKKLCLLYWAVFRAGYEVPRDYIIECWRAEQFLVGLQTLGEARDRGHAILDELVKKALLEKGSKWAHYKMYQHFQRAALRIANCRENRVRILVKEREKIREEEWESADRISLISSCQLIFPESPKCCRILALFVQECSLAEFPSSFFSYMNGLQLLDLHDTNIKSLPSSISSLVNLNVLFLNRCSQLTHLPVEIGGLQRLEILDLCHSGFHSLPAQIGQLTNLKCLRVSFIENFENHNHVDSGPKEMIATNIIARLQSLEELSIYVNPASRRWIQNAESIAEEIATLEELRTLSFYFPSVDCLQTFVNKSKSWNGNDTLWRGNSFRSFSIDVGYQRRSSPPVKLIDSKCKCTAEKHLRFSAGEGFPDAVAKILEEACALELIGNNVVNISCLSTADKLGGLEACVIEECGEMTSIIDGDLAGGPAFQQLNELHLLSLPKLVHIWNGPIDSKSLTMLTTLTLKGCHSLKALVSEAMALRLNQLQFLQVEDCRVIEEIFETGIIVESGAFPKLKNLQLINLPRLSNICSAVTPLDWPSLETIMIRACEELRNFPSTISNAARLRKIKCTERWWNNLAWANDNARNHLEGVKEFLS